MLQTIIWRVRYPEGHLGRNIDKGTNKEQKHPALVIYKQDSFYFQMLLLAFIALLTLTWETSG